MTYDPKLNAQVKKLLSNPEHFPDEFKAWLATYMSTNPNVVLGRDQIPREAVPYVGLMSAGPPSPFPNRVWFATFGTRTWAFRYDAESTSANKWEFIGGPPTTSYIPDDETTTSGTFADLATVATLNIPRDGDYIINWSVEHYNATPAAAGIVGVTGSTTGTGIARSDTHTPAANYHLHSAGFQNAALVGGETIKMQYATSAGTHHFLRRWLQVYPIRVK